MNVGWSRWFRSAGKPRARRLGAAGTAPVIAGAALATVTVTGAGPASSAGGAAAARTVSDRTGAGRR